MSSRSEIKAARRGHIVVGKVVLEGGGDPRQVSAQMVILDEGYFVDAVGRPNRPIGFRLHGYEPVDAIPDGGPLEDLGEIRLKPLSPEKLASATGTVEVEARAGAPRFDEVDVLWQISAEPINTPTNGTDGLSPFHRPVPKSKLGKEGTFSAQGMSPTNYYLHVTAPRCVRNSRVVSFEEGKNTDIGTIKLEVARSMTVEFAVSPDCQFQDAEIMTTKLTAEARWRATKETPEYASDLAIDQKDGELLLTRRYGPCFVTDLGKATLKDKLNCIPADLVRDNQQSEAVKDGHVYLVHQMHWKHWILFRATLDAIEPEQKPN
jgi:hypothetical protein